MKQFDKYHILYLSLTLIYYIIGFIICRKSNRLVQNIIFILTAALANLGIFYRYALNLSFDFSNINLTTLAIEMLQVCNFNYILVILMLVPKFAASRQYSMYFSAFAAMTAHLSIPSSFKNLEFYDISIINSWLNHMFSIALPLFIIASRRDKPKIKYIIPVIICIFSYFTIVYIISSILIKNGIIMPENSFSFIYDRGKTTIFDIFYNILPYDYFYLYLIFPLVVIFVIIIGYSFKKYKLINEKFYL